MKVKQDRGMGKSLCNIIELGNYLCDMEVGQMSTLNFNNKPYIIVRLKDSFLSGEVKD